MKTKWSIIVECEAKNLKEFDGMFYDYHAEDLVISRKFIKGVMMIDEDGTIEREE